MEPLPSETPSMATCGRNSDVERPWFEQLCFELGFEQYLDEYIWAGEISSTPATYPPALPSFLASPQSPSDCNRPPPPCSEFLPSGVAAPEGIEAPAAGSSHPAFDLKDFDHGGEYGPETVQQLMEVDSPAKTGHVGLTLAQAMQGRSIDIEAMAKACAKSIWSLMDTSTPAGLGGVSKLKILREKTFGDFAGVVNAGVPKRGPRSPNFTSLEKYCVLELRLEAQRAAVTGGKVWDYISEALKDRYGVERSAQSCECLWGTLQKPFKVIPHHEQFVSDGCSYFELNENERSELQLPKSSSPKWYEMIESVLAGKGKAAAGDQELTWTTTDQLLMEGAGEVSSLLRLADHGLCNPETQGGLGASAPGKTSTLNTLTVSELQELGPYLKSFAYSAVQAALQPLATILQREQEEEQEFDAKMKAIAKKRRDLDLEEMQIKRQRVDQNQRTSRSTFRRKQPQAGLPVKKASVKKAPVKKAAVKKIVPASFQG